MIIFSKFSMRFFLIYLQRYGLSGTALSNAFVRFSVVCAAQAIPPVP